MRSVETAPWRVLRRWWLLILLVGIALLTWLCALVYHDQAFAHHSRMEDATVVRVDHHYVRHRGGTDDEPSFEVVVDGRRTATAVTGLGLAKAGDRVSVMVDTRDSNHVESVTQFDGSRIYYFLLGVFGAIFTGVGLLSIPRR